MKTKQLIVSALAVSGLLCGWTQAAGVATGDPAPAFTLTDASGASHSLSDYKGKYVVLEWINYGCPFVQRHYNSKSMPSLQEKYTDKGVVWLSICSSGQGQQGYMEPADIAKANAAHGYAGTAYLVDADGKVGHLFSARNTPHMFVINPDGTIGYQGAIDSNPRSFDGATNYVAEYLDLSMNGEPVKTTTTNPYGCGIHYAN